MTRQLYVIFATMKQFTSHINYLIQKHDCVIIPDFGGFVLNRENAYISETGVLVAPRVSVGFNPDLKYNDGLLAESYMNVYSISYNAACKKISDAVGRLNTILNFRQPVQIGNLGKLSLNSDNVLTFAPNNNLSLIYPETYGLSNLTIKRLIDVEIHETLVEAVNPRKAKRIAFRQILTGVGAAAAAAIIFFVSSTPIADNQSENLQMSGFLTPNINIVNTNPISKVSNTATIAIDSASVSISEKVIATDTLSFNKAALTPNKDQEEKIVEVKKENHKYFIIIGSPGNKKDAQTALQRLKNQGYASANIIESSDRARIYIASFNDKNQANQYLDTFRKDNPALSDAWLYSKR